MKIRLAAAHDIAAGVELGRRMHAITRFCAYDFNAERVETQLRNLVTIGQNTRGSHCFLLAEDNAGQMAGALLGCIEQHFFSDLKVASVIHYVVLPERQMSGAGLRLLTAFRAWAVSRGVYELAVGINSGVEPEKSDRFLKRLGFQFNGGNYSARLAP